MLMVQPVTHALATTAAVGADHTQTWHWVSSRDGQTALAHGCDATALLPRDADVVLVLPVLATSWHRVVLPKIGSARLRQALDGLLEDRLLSDPTQLHLALEPGLQAGQSGWIAACERQPVSHWLTLLQAAERPANRIVPDLCPQDPPRLHALVCAGAPWLVATQAQGVVAVPLADTTTSDHTSDHTAAHPLPSHPGLPCWAEPACVALAEAALDAPATVHTTAQRLLASAQTGWNLAQFDLSLSAHARRSQRLGQALRAVLHAPRWRTARWGAGVLALALLLNLQGRAWQERHSLQAKQTEVAQLLTRQFPQVTLVLDAPRQMQQEVARLRRTHGDPGPHDLEGFLQTFGHTALSDIELSAIQFTSTEVQLTLTTPTAAAPSTERMQALREQLQAQGWRTDYAAPVLSARPATERSAAALASGVAPGNPTRPGPP